MKEITKWRIIIGNIVFAISVSYFYFRTDAPKSFRMIVYILLMVVLAIGTMNQYKVRNKEGN